MIRIMLGVAALAIATGTAQAEQKYDRTLEKAAMKIVADKIGGLRGGFAFDEAPRLVQIRENGTLFTLVLRAEG